MLWEVYFGQIGGHLGFRLFPWLPICFEDATQAKMNLYDQMNTYEKFGAFVTPVTICPKIEAKGPYYSQ